MAPSLWLATSTRGSIFLSRFGGFRGLTLSWATPHEGNKSRKCRGSFLLYKFYLKRIGNRAIFPESWGTPHEASLGPSKELAASFRKSLFREATHKETRCFGVIFCPKHDLTRPDKENALFPSNFWLQAFGWPRALEGPFS